MATRNPMWQEEPEERQIGIDPFSLRQLSRVDIDRPLPIPAVSVDDHHLPAPYAPARSASASVSVPCSSAPSPRLSSSAATPPTRWDAHLALATSSAAETTCLSSRAVSRSKSCAGVGEMELADNEFDVILSSPERRASAPQRWGSDVPLIADARGKDGRRRGKHGTEAAPFGCCLYLPGLTRRNKLPPSPTAAAAGRSSSGRLPSATFRGPAAVQPAESETDEQSMARESTMSLAVSLERFEYRFSTRSSGGLAALDESSYFDLPLELILGCDDDDDDDTGLPMHAAFMFDSDSIRKSVLKKGAQRAVARPSCAKVSIDASGNDRISARHHVKFSVTSRSADS